MTEECDLETLKTAYPITHCPDCGYSRTGLDAAHTCPECGWTPENDVVIVYSNSTSKTTEFNWRNLLPLLPLAFMLLFVFYGDLLPQGVWRAYFFILVPFALAVIFGVLQRGTREQAGTFQIRAGPGGFAVRVGYGRATLRPWPPRTVVRSARTLIGRRLLQIGTRLPFTPFVSSYFITIDAVAAEPLYALERQLRRWAERE